MFRGKVVVVTGGSQGIGKAIVDGFEKEGARVCIIDLKDNPYFVGDIAEEGTLRTFAEKVLKDYGHIDFLINNACLSKGGLMDCDYESFMYVQKVGVVAPFMLSKLFMDYFNENGAIVNISSTREHLSQGNTESYSAAKGGIGSLTHAMAITLSGKVRVNAISPGWIDTTNDDQSIVDHKQQPVGRIGKPEDIVNMVLFLCSEKASFMTGENITIDGGMSKQMIYHGENGWKFGLD